MSSLRPGFEVVISNGTSVSTDVDLGDLTLVGVITPAAWTAAAITFEASRDGTTWLPMRNQTAEVSIASAQISTSQARYISVDPNTFRGVSRIRLRSGVSGTLVNQLAERALVLVAVRPELA